MDFGYAKIAPPGGSQWTPADWDHTGNKWAENENFTSQYQRVVGTPFAKEDDPEQTGHQRLQHCQAGP